MPDFTYITGTLFFLGLWALGYRLLPESRKIMLWSGAAWGHLGPIGEYWFNPRYWHPEYLFTFRIGSWTFGLEDYLFAFAFAGLCAGLFDSLRTRSSHLKLEEPNHHSLLTLLFISSVYLVALALLIMALKVPPMQANILLSCIGTVVLLTRHPAWILPALFLGVVAGLGMWLFYWGFFIRLFPGIFHLWWNPEVVQGVTLAGVPIEEIAWAASSGLFLGPVARWAHERV